MNKIKISRVATTPPQDSILQYRIMGSKYIHRMWNPYSRWKEGIGRIICLMASFRKEEVGNFTSIGGDYCG